MTTTERQSFVKCPFWAAVSMKCSISNGGLFIPLDNHREIFCATPHFRECRQFSLYSENQNYSPEKVRKSVVNRRKYLRFASSHQITRMKVFNSGQPVSYNSTKINTLDVSKGGMRIATDRPVGHETVIQFYFDNSFPHALQKVCGQVAWCNKKADEFGYQAGVCFTTDQMIEEMGRFLDQQHKHLL